MRVIHSAPGLEHVWHEDGSFTVTNTRNGFTKAYAARR
jgi:hypothetical protein